MIHIEDLSKQLPKPNAATIGFFDGVHRGHCDLIAQLLQVAKEKKLSSLLITFPNHPLTVIRPPWQPKLLTTFQEKLKLLADTGADYCASFPFTQTLARLTAREFMKTYLHDQLNVKVLLIGYDNHFGSVPSEGFKEYEEYGKELGIEVIKSHEYMVHGKAVSSSVIRTCLEDGDVEKASLLLRRAYQITGLVVKGHRVGRKLGFPTANITLDDPLKMLPADGGYAVSVNLKGKTYAGMLNVGKRPTFENEGQRSIEVNLLHFEGNLYGKNLTVNFVQRLRGERKFQSPEELSAQLAQDMKDAEKIIEQKYNI